MFRVSRSRESAMLHLTPGKAGSPQHDLLNFDSLDRDH